MNETAAGCSRHGKLRRPPPAAPSTSPSFHSSFNQTLSPMGSPLQPPHANDQMDESHRVEHGSKRIGVQAREYPSSCFHEGLFCATWTSTAPVPLAAALAFRPGPEGDVVKQGYLGKLERNHRRYFVLRAGSHTGPSRLEWYVTQEKFTATEKSDGKATLFGSSKQRVIYLRCCLGVSRTASSRKGHTVSLYAKDQTMVLVAGDQGEQEEWYRAIKNLIEEERKCGENGEGCDEEDDGYCTLPPVAIFKEVWPVTVKPKGLGRTKSLAGETRLCLSTTSLILVKLGADEEIPSVTLPLVSVRRFGRSEGLFYLEVGRSAPNGPGMIWMEAGDQGDPTLAQHIHDAVREAMRALRALPDFSQPPTSSHNHPRALLASKRGRPKYREKAGLVRPLTLPPASPLRSPCPSEIPASEVQCRFEPSTPKKTNRTLNLSPFRCRQSSMSEAGSYMEMTMHRLLSADKVMEDQCGGISLVRQDHCRVPASRVEDWEPGEEEGPGYMMMSPQKSSCCPDLPHDDYVTMSSPLIHTWSASSSSSFLKMSFNSSSSPNRSYQTTEVNKPDCLVSGVQQPEPETSLSEMLSCSPLAQGDAGLEDEEPGCRHLSEQATPTSRMLKTVLASGLPTPVPAVAPGNSQPVPAHPIHLNTDRSCPVQAVPDQSAAPRYWLSSCLFCCMQAKDGL